MMLRKAFVIATTAAALACAVAAVQVAHGGRSSAPVGLSAYGRLVWNLDALVHDYYSGAHACMRAQRFAIHRCSSARFNDGDYRATFWAARRSSFRAVGRSSNPLRAVNVVPITIGGRYVQCGADRWLAITNAAAGWGEPVYCVTT
jgi:hypothetical protein